MSDSKTSSLSAQPTGAPRSRKWEIERHGRGALALIGTSNGEDRVRLDTNEIFDKAAAACFPWQAAPGGALSYRAPDRSRPSGTETYIPCPRLAPFAAPPPAGAHRVAGGIFESTRSGQPGCRRSLQEEKNQAMLSPLRKRAGHFVSFAAVISLSLMAFLGSGATAAVAAGCPNEAARVGASANLPDCRAYELVTPRNTNGLMPFGGIGVHTSKSEASAAYAGMGIDTPSISADGNSFLWLIVGTTLPGTDGNGTNNQYVAERTATGWQSRLQGPNSHQAEAGIGGGATGDFSYQAFTTERAGSLVTPYGTDPTTWVRQPDGSFRPVGEGTVPAGPDTDGYENGRADDLFDQIGYITPSGDHQIFYGNHGEAIGHPIVPLTPDAPTNNVSAVYDRTPSGLHLVSVLPDDTVPTIGSTYAGASSDGSVIAFLTGTGASTTLYARIDNTSTQELVSGSESDFKPAGATNHKVFYWNAGDLYVYNLDSEETTPITSTGDATYVRVSEDGSRVFFLSDSQLDGAKGEAGQPNLYVWDGSEIKFIATTRAADTEATITASELSRGGIDYWVSRDSSPIAPATHWKTNQNTTRATSDGGVFAFTSTADITGQNPGNYFQVYRYVVASDSVMCVSCPPDGSDATADSFLTDGGIEAGTSTEIPSMTEEGSTVFFETAQSLVPRDSDGKYSVYEWRGGEVALLSSGSTGRGDHIVGMTPDGSQVFISTTDQLVPNGQVGGVGAIYDARVNGGFPYAEESGCSGAACLGATNGSPMLPLVGSIGFMGPGSPTASVNGKVRIAGHRTVRGRRFRLTVRTPGAGMIVVRGGQIRNIRRRVPRASAYKIPLRLARNSVRQLHRRGRIRVPVRVNFTPGGVTRSIGQRSSRRATLTVRLPNRSSKRHASSTRRAHR